MCMYECMMCVFQKATAPKEECEESEREGMLAYSFERRGGRTAEKTSRLL